MSQGPSPPRSTTTATFFFSSIMVHLAVRFGISGTKVNSRAATGNQIVPHAWAVDPLDDGWIST